MTTRRNRRVSAAPPAERVYTEEDYAAPNPAGLSHEETPYAEQMGWAEPAQESFQAEDEPLWAAEPEEEYLPLQEAGYDPLYESEIDYLDDGDPLDEDLLTEEEQAELRRSQWQMLATLADFAGVILGVGAILLLVALLVSLLNWLVGDISQSFTLLQKHL